MSVAFCLSSRSFEKSHQFDGFFVFYPPFMNYLSHFFLSAKAPDDIHLGNFLGDIVPKSVSDSLPESIQKGIEFHRFIDHFTDNHERVLDGKRLLYTHFGKYASVILDVYFDFILIENWSDYDVQPVEAFMDICYDFIDQNMDSVPDIAKSRVQAMNSARWMDGYLWEKGRQDLFGRLAKRARYDKNFQEASHIYIQKRADLMDIHQIFFQDLMEACNDWLDKV